MKFHDEAAKRRNSVPIVNLSDDEQDDAERAKSNDDHSTVNQ